MHTGFWWKNHNERDQQEDPDIGGRIITEMDVTEIGWGDVGWIHLA
jgi:hypothetical protein